MPAVVDHLSAEVALTEHRVAGDHTPLQDQSTQQAQGRLVLVGLAIDLGLPQGQAASLGHRRQQMDGPVVAREAAPQGFAVQADRFEAPVE